MKKKNLKLLAVLLMALSMKTLNSFAQNQSLVGSWVLESVDRQQCTDSTFAGLVKMPCTQTTCNKVRFNSDGSLRYTTLNQDGKEINNGTFTILGSTIKQCPVNQSGQNCVLVTYALADNKLVITSKGEEDSGCDIILTYHRE